MFPLRDPIRCPSSIDITTVLNIIKVSDPTFYSDLEMSRCNIGLKPIRDDLAASIGQLVGAAANLPGAGADLITEQARAN